MDMDMDMVLTKPLALLPSKRLRLCLLVLGTSTRTMATGVNPVVPGMERYRQKPTIERVAAREASTMSSRIHRQPAIDSCFPVLGCRG